VLKIVSAKLRAKLFPEPSSCRAFLSAFVLLSLLSLALSLFLLFLFRCVYIYIYIYIDKHYIIGNFVWLNRCDRMIEAELKRRGDSEQRACVTECPVGREQKIPLFEISSREKGRRRKKKRSMRVSVLAIPREKRKAIFTSIDRTNITLTKAISSCSNREAYCWKRTRDESFVARPGSGTVPENRTKADLMTLL